MTLTPREREELTRLREQMAQVLVEYASISRKVDGHGRTLYGTQGNGGLNADVQGVISTVASHMQREGKAIEQQGILLVGDHGDAGMLKDVRTLIDALHRYERIRKAFWALVAAFLLQAAGAVVVWLLNG